MADPHDAELPDTRRALRAYAALLVTTGVIVAGWGPMWFQFRVEGLPWGDAALIRLAGSVLIALGLWAGGLAAAGARARSPLFSRFIAAHIVVWLMLLVQIGGPLGGVPMARHVAWALLAAIASLLYIRFPTPLRPRRLLSLDVHAVPTNGRAPTYDAYEREIREAAAQEERNRLARDLHDAVKQQIFAIQTNAATAEARFDTDPPGARDALARIRQSAREAVAEMQALLDQLRAAPLGTTGLVEAIRQQCEALGFRTGADVEVEVGEMPPQDAFEPGALQAIFRIAQEALANVGRHARARHVRVALGATPGGFELTVRDDGRGFDEDRRAGGMGVQNMQARAGEIGGSVEVRSTNGAGTLVTLSIPLETADVRRYRRRRELGFVALIGVAIVGLALGLLENGPGLGIVPLVIFVLLFSRHVRAWWRLRPVDDEQALRRTPRDDPRAR